MYELRQKLTPTHLAIIEMLAIVRAATSKQIERLHFTRGTSISRTRICNLTLRRLHDLGVLARWRRPNGGVGGGSDPYYYVLDRAGQMMGRPDKTYYWRQPDLTAQFIQHRLAVTELYITCHETNLDGVALEKFEPEPQCWRQLPGYGRHMLKPDAHIELSTEKILYSWFIEVDMGTERLERIKEKLQLYHRYYMTGREQSRHKNVFPKVLFMVLDLDRKKRIEAVVKRQPQHAQRLFQVELQSSSYQVLVGSVTARLEV